MHTRTPGMGVSGTALGRLACSQAAAGLHVLAAFNSPSLGM